MIHHWKTLSNSFSVIPNVGSVTLYAITNKGIGRLKLFIKFSFMVNVKSAYKIIFSIKIIEVLLLLQSFCSLVFSIAKRIIATVPFYSNKKRTSIKF